MTTREAFIAAIRTFKRTEKVKLHAVFDPNSPDIKAQKALLQNPDVMAHLQRPRPTQPNHQHLLQVPPAKNSETKAASDYYEARLYTLMNRFVPFRGAAHMPNFYSEGATDRQLAHLHGAQADRLSGVGVTLVGARHLRDP